MKTVQPHDLIRLDDLQDLAAVDDDICVSLFMPTHPSAPESHQDPVRFKNLLNEAEVRLRQREQQSSDAEHLLKPARELLGEDFFWTHQSEGLAVFLTPSAIRKYRLPAPFEQSIEVARQFLVTPVVSLLKPGHAFYVVAVSQNSCRLFRGTQFQVEAVASEDLPKDLESALGWWRERELNYHSHGQGRSDTAIYHGHEEDDKSIDLAAYLRKVANPLASLLHNQSAPLLFAGVDELFPIFRAAFGQQGLIPENLAGNPDQLTASQLHQMAWPIVEGYHRQQSAQVWDDYHAAQNQDQATNALSIILPACRDGLVALLLIGDGTRHAGVLDEKAGQIYGDGKTGQAIDLLNLAAVFALRTGAKVLAVPPAEIPAKASAAAILRSPVSAVQVFQE